MILGNNYIRDIKLGNKRVELAVGNTPALKYKRLDYISSTLTGGQWIDLGCKLFSNTDLVLVDIKFNLKTKGKDDNLQGVLLGANDESKSNIWPGMLLRLQSANTSNNVEFKIKNADYTYYINGINDSTTLNNGNFYITSGKLQKNKVYNIRIITTNWYGNSTHNKNTTLFAGLDSSGIPFRYSNADIYYLKLYKNGLLVRDLIPVQRISDNEVGLLDLVNNVFYPSQGDDSFVAGYNYDSELLYLESTGNQYINLDYPIWNHGLSGYIVLLRLDDTTSNKAYIGRVSAGGVNLCTSGKGQILLHIDKNDGSDVAIISDETENIDKEIHHVAFNINDSGIAYLTVDNIEYYDNYLIVSGLSANLLLFSHRGYYNSIGRIYSCELWYNGSMIYDFIPVRKDGVGYMYDKLTSNLYGDSSSSGIPFNLGPDI